MNYPGAGRSGLNRPWRTAPTSVEKLGEDPWGGVKVFSNLEIARSLRNGFRASLEPSLAGVERRNSAGGLPAYPPKPNSEYRAADPGRQSAGEKLRAREGKHPDRRPRPPKRRSVRKEVGSL